MSTITATITPILGQAVDSQFWGTQLGGMVKALLAAVGVVVVIYGIARSIGKFASGKAGEGFKQIILTVLLAAFMFRPQLMTAMVDLASNVFDALFRSGQDIIENAPAGTPQG